MVEVTKLEPWQLMSLAEECGTTKIEAAPGFLDAALSGTCIALTINGELVGCAGIVELWENCAELWSYISNRARKSPVALSRASKRFIEEHGIKYRRLQIVVKEEDSRAKSFAEFLGFIFEGRMLYYSPEGETYLRYARIHNG